MGGTCGPVSTTMSKRVTGGGRATTNAYLCSGTPAAPVVLQGITASPQLSRLAAMSIHSAGKGVASSVDINFLIALPASLSYGEALDIQYLL